MSHRDRDCRSSFGVGAQELSKAVEWLLAEIEWKSIRFRCDCGWTARALATAGLLWAWSCDATLRERLQQALEVARRIGGRGVPQGTSYQAFIKLLVRWTEPLRFEMFCALRTRMEREFPGQFRIAGFVVLAGDGSKIELPRTESNEARFSPAKTRPQRKKQRRRGRRARSRKAQQQRAREKKADSPQLALTTLFHVGLRLPWDWRIGPSDESEREHLRDMISDLPPDALITADCGFVGYDFWQALLDSGREFVIRVGGNVRLLKQLGVVRESPGTIYLWPDKAAKRGRSPLVLRLVVVQGARHPWYLVTSVREPKRLSDRQVAEIYRQRWGIELFFRHFKQTFGRGKLRSHKAEHAECELQWSLLGLWTMLLYAQKLLPHQMASPPRLSVARVLRAFRRALTDRLPTDRSLADLLAAAVVDPYQRRDKRSRGYPRKKYEPPARAPRITRANQTQRTLAQQLALQLSERRLPA
jgi:DDE family transposase